METEIPIAIGYIKECMGSIAFSLRGILVVLAADFILNVGIYLLARRKG